MADKVPHHEPMVIRWIGINVGQGFSYHNHRDEGVYEIHFLVENAGNFLNGDDVYPGRAGMLLLSTPAQSHQAWVDRPGQTMTVYSVSFMPDQGDNPLVSLMEEHFGARPYFEVGKGHALTFEDMRRKVASGNPMLIQSANYRLVSFIYDTLSGHTRNHQPRGQMYVDEALSVMQGSLTSSLNLDDLALRLGIDKSYFVRLFKQIMGMSPLKYYLSLKMDAASHNLRSSDKPIRQVAAEFGYKDEYYFSRVFKNQVGVSPTEFRSRK